MPIEQAVWSQFLEDYIADDVKNAGDGPLNAADLHLFQNDISLSKHMVLTDFVEADFDGYAAQEVVWLAKFRQGDATHVRSTLEQWLMNGATTPNTIYGWWLQVNSTDDILMAHRYETPKQMTGVGASIAVVIEYVINGSD